MTYFAKLWYHVSTCLYVCVRCGLVFWQHQVVSMLDTSIQALLTACRKPKLQTYGTRLLYLMHLTASSLLHVVSKACSIDNMKAPIRPSQFMDTGYCTYWHFSSSDGVSVPLTWGLTGWPCYVSTIILLFCFFRPIQAARWSAMHTTPATAQPGAFLRVEFYWLGDVSALGLTACDFVTLNFQHLSTGNLLHVQRSVSPWLGMLKGKTKGALMSMLHPCWTPACHYPSATLPLVPTFFWRGRLKQCQTMATCDAKRGRQTSSVVKVPLSLTFPCLTVCWSWHFPRQQEQTSCRWLLIAITGGASWVRALAGNLDVATDG